MKMAKIRALKPEFFTGEDLVELSPLARLLFQGMWVHACDNGHVQDRPKQLKLRILPADDCDIVGPIDEMVNLGMVKRSDGWLTVPTLATHQKPDKRYFLRCDFPGCKDGDKSLSGRKEATPDPTESTTGAGSDHSTHGDGDNPSLRSGGAGGDRDESRELALINDSTTTDVDVPTTPKPKHGTRIPENWQPARTPGNKNAESGHSVKWLRRQLDKFRDYWADKSGKDATKIDWDATWRNWLRNADDFEAKRPSQPRTGASMTEADWDRLMAEAQAADEADRRSAS